MKTNERVKLIRNKLKLNQTDFGSRIAIAQTYLSQIEKGDRELTEKLSKLICFEFGVNETWLNSGEGEMFFEPDREEAITIWAAKITRDDYDNDFVRKFANMLTKLDENDWKTIEKMMILMEQDNINK